MHLVSTYTACDVCATLMNVWKRVGLFCFPVFLLVWNCCSAGLLSDGWKVADIVLVFLSPLTRI